MRKILLVNNKAENKFLRRRTSDFDFNRFSQAEIRELIKEMRQTMEAADGIGLAANQIGLDWRCFVAKVGNKFYAIFNPEIVKTSAEKVSAEEGCLSVPDVYGEVLRPEQVVLKGFDKNGKPIKLKAWGTLARVFQHEVDHLNGILFTDHLKR
jgi:peptide deformylase